MSRGILINYPLELPSSCYKCFAYSHSEYVCRLTNKGLTDDFDTDQGYNLFRQRHKDCPLEYTDIED